jgi:hypothetical protein
MFDLRVFDDFFMSFFTTKEEESLFAESIGSIVIKLVNPIIIKLLEGLFAAADTPTTEGDEEDLVNPFSGKT